MPTYTLQARQQAHVPGKKLVLKVEKSQNGPDLAVDVIGASQTRPAHMLTSDSWMVEAHREAVDIRLRPRRSQDFPADSTYSLTLSEDSSGHAVRVGGVNVSGSSSVIVVRLDPQPSPGGLEVIALPYHTHEVRLSAPAHAARTMARRLAGVDAALSGPAIDVEVLVDATTSMRAFHESGALSPLVQTLLGVSSVLSESGDFTVALATDRVHWRSDPDAPPGEGPLPVDFEEVHSVFVSALALEQPAQVTYIVTDDIPFDLEELGAQAGSGTSCHVVLWGPADWVESGHRPQAPAVRITGWPPSATSPQEAVVQSLLVDHLPSSRPLPSGSPS